MRVLAVAVGLFALSSVPLLHTGDGDARGTRALVGPIQVTASAVSLTTRRVGRTGRISDTTEQVWLLHDRYGRPIGRWLLSCRWVSDTARLCTTVVRMPLGQITVTGASATPFVGSYAVVGGTGRYDGATGIADFVVIGQRKLILSIQLT